MISRAALSVILPAALLLGACAQTRWEHPGFGPEATAMALDECQRLAWSQARQEEFFYGGYGGRRVVRYRDRDGRIRYATEWPSPLHTGAFREQDLTSYCMRSKGFELKAVEGS